MTTFTGHAGQDDVFVGAANVADLFVFKVADFDGNDTVTGGSGSTVDMLQFTSAGTIASGSFAKTSGIEQILLFGSGATTITVTDALASSAAAGRLTIVSGGGSDTIDGSLVTTSTSRLDITAGSGADHLTGGAANDTFRFDAAELTGADSVAGGAGIDMLTFGTAGAVKSLAGVTGVERIFLAAGGNAITLGNGQFTDVVGAIAVIGGAGADQVNGSGLGAANALNITAGGGDDTLKGGSGADLFRFDVTEFTGADVVSGGGGMDTLLLIGGTSGGGFIDLTGANVAGIETVSLDNHAHSVRLATGVVTAATGSALTIDSGNGADSIDATGVLAGTLKVTTGGGVDSLTVTTDGTATIRGNLNEGQDTLDVFLGSGGATLMLNGGGDTDTITFHQQAATGFTMTADLAGFERVELTDADAAGTFAFTSNGTAGLQVFGLDAGTAYSITLSGVNQVAQGGSLGDTLVGLGGRQQLFGNDGADHIDGGAGADACFGGAGDDTIVYDAADVMQNGGADTDTLVSLTGGTFHLANTADQSDAGGVTQGFENLSFAGSGVGGAQYGTKAVNVLTGGDGNDLIDGLGGADVIAAGNGDDTVVYYAAAASIDGGGAATTGFGDTLVLMGKATVDLRAADQVSGGGSTSGFESVDASGSTVAVDLTGADTAIGPGGVGSRLIGSQAGDAITAGAAGAYITGGLGADTLQGGAAGDRFIYNAAGEFQAGETVDGGGGYDSVDVLASMSFLGDAINVEQVTAFYGATVTLSASNAAHVGAVSGAYNDGFTETFIVLLDANQTVDLSGFGLVAAGSGTDAGDSLTIKGTSGAETVTLSQSMLTFQGGGGDDVIHASTYGTYGAGSSIQGGGGNDRVDYRANDGTIDGGSGVDTLVLNAAATVNLANAADQASGGGVTIGFENVDASAATTAVTLAGRSDVASILTGGTAADSITGAHGGSVITGGAGADTLTGGAGPDSFVWNAATEGGDTITDFTPGSDTLHFGPAFYANGADGFSTRVVGDASADISTADLFVYTGSASGTAAIRTLINDTHTGAAGQGLFVVASDGADTHLYWAPDAGGATDATVYEIADLGGVAATTIQTSDFFGSFG